MSKVKNIISKPNYKSERNKKIYAEYLAGSRFEVLAVKYNLHFNRISQICKQQKIINSQKKEVKKS